MGIITELLKIYSDDNFDRDPLTELIHDESVQLAKKLLDFDKTVSKKDRMDDSQFEPTIQGVIKVTQQVFERWEKNKREGFMGTTKALFHRFCDGINSHSSMLKVLPEGSEYVSLFTGVLSVVINVCLNLVNCLRLYKLKLVLGERKSRKGCGGFCAESLLDR